VAVDWKETQMSDSVYKVIELVGTSTESWEKAAATAIQRAQGSLSDLRIAEVAQLDLQLGGEQVIYRAKVRVSFKYND
jgi:flavin-binding protein dodecin